MKKTCLAVALTLGLALTGAIQAEAAVKVRVQPNGSTIPEAYAITGETRTYFGNVANCPGTCEYKWDFSDGASSSWANVGNTRYIDTTHSYASSGLNWARLTVRDQADPANSNTATIEVQTLSSAADTDTRKKNSAVDNGLRWQYQNEAIDGSGSHWGNSTGYYIGATSMALIAFENHRHNLESSDDDIYKASVEGGMQWLFNQAYEVQMTNQPCIGNPEGVPGDPAHDDGDSDNDGKGIAFTDSGYETPLAMLAIVNSCEKATAKTKTISSANSVVNGMKLWDAMVEVKDFLAWAQTDRGASGGNYSASCDDSQNGINTSTSGWKDGSNYSFYTAASVPNGGAGDSGYCYDSNGNSYVYYYNSSGNTYGFYTQFYPAPDCSTFQMRIDPGDGSGKIAINNDSCTNGGWAYPYNYTYYTYNTPGTYTPTAEYTTDGGQTWNTICTLGQNITIQEPKQLDCQNLFFQFNYGDGTSATVSSDYCDPTYAYVYNYGHAYSTPGTYTPSTSYSNDGGASWVTGCSLQGITVVDQSGGDCSDQGEGWRYGSNYNSIDNSVSQWPVLALSEARDRWGINVNPKVIEAFKPWLAYSQGAATGGFPYDWPNNWENFGKTGAGLVMLKWAGFGTSDTNVQNAISFLDNHWSDTDQGGNTTEDFYAMYAFYKGMKSHHLSTLGARNWEDIYRDRLIASQQADGHWNNTTWLSMPAPDISTSTGLAMLAPAIGGLPPVAEAGGPYGPANAGQSIALDGSGSTHQDPTKALVKYEWDFNAADGLWWDSKSAPDPGEGAVAISPSTSYPDTGSDHVYTVTLRVTDNSTPAMTSTDTATVAITSGEVAPVAKTNGPWSALPNNDIVFDGSASFDPNSCTTPGNPSCLGDSIVAYEWDLNGDGVFNGPGDGTPVVAGDYSKVKRSYASPVQINVTLKVRDKFGREATASGTANIVSIALTYATNYNYCFQDTISRTQIREGVAVQFTNLGNGTAENVKVTLTQAPTNLSILKNTSTLGNMAPGAKVTTQCTSNPKSADIEVRLDRTVNPQKDWRWKAEFDLNGSHHVIDNLPPLAP